MPVGLGVPSPPSALLPLFSEFQPCLGPLAIKKECGSSTQPVASILVPTLNPTAQPIPPSPTKIQTLCPGMNLKLNLLSSPARALLTKKKLTWKISPQLLNRTP